MSKKFEKLYKISSNGQKISEWSIESTGDTYIITTGYTDGLKQSFPTKIMDRKNSRDLEEQADRVAESAWNEKRKTMYPSIREAHDAFTSKSMALGGYKPMLAEMYDPSKKQKFNIANCIIQPKLDGIRLLARKVDDEVLLYARSGALKTTTPHVNEQLNEVMENGEILDGELYKHGLELEDILSLVQSTKNTKDTSEIEYWVYDIPRMGNLVESEPYFKRLNEFMNRYGDSGDIVSESVRLTPSIQLESIQEIEQFHTDIVNDGYEGAILRNPLAPYQNKRTKDLLKVKKFQDAEFEIIGVKEGKGKLAGHGIFTCRTSSGKTFDVKMKGETSELIRYFEYPEEVIGKMLTVQFFSYTKHNTPRFPVGIRIREEL